MKAGIMPTETVIADVVEAFKRIIGDPKTVYGLKLSSAWVVGQPPELRLAATFRRARNRVLGYEQRAHLYTFTSAAVGRAVIKALPAALAA